MSGSPSLPPMWKRVTLVAISIFCLIGGFSNLVTTSPVSMEWFAGLALVALFLPVLVISASQIPAIGRHLGGPMAPSDPRVAALLLGCLTLTFVAGGSSGAIGYLVHGMTGFRGHNGRWISMPLFLGVCAFGAVVFGLLTGLALRRRR